MDVDAFMRLSVDPIWLQQNVMWEFVDKCASAKEDQQNLTRMENNTFDRLELTIISPSSYS